MKIQLDCRSSFFDALEAISNEGYRARVVSDENDLTISPQDEDAQEAVYSLLCDLELVANRDDRLYPGESMDGDFDSAMESAGFGYDEQYDHNATYEGD
jgi:hypothetical protein